MIVFSHSIRSASARSVHLGHIIKMNSVVLPGVTFGPKTIVGAGSVVTKSFPEGQCVIAGNPARVIKRLDHGEKLG